MIFPASKVRWPLVLTSAALKIPREKNDSGHIRTIAIHIHIKYVYIYIIYIVYIYIQPFLLTRSGCDFHFVVRILRNPNVPTRKSQTCKIPGQNAPWRPLGNQQSNLTLFWHKCHVQEWKSQPTVKYRQHEGVKNTYVTRMCTSRCFFFII